MPAVSTGTKAQLTCESLQLLHLHGDGVAAVPVAKSLELLKEATPYSLGVAGGAGGASMLPTRPVLELRAEKTQKSW